VARFFITGFLSLVAVLLAWAATKEARSSAEPMLVLAWWGAAVALASVPLLLLKYYGFVLAALVIAMGVVGMWLGLDELTPETGVLLVIACALFVVPFVLVPKLFPGRKPPFAVEAVSCAAVLAGAAIVETSPAWQLVAGPLLIALGATPFFLTSRRRRRRTGPSPPGPDPAGDADREKPRAAEPPRPTR
jgi:hypothetical protein